ncbi:DUF2155 domain-containing protein [Caulobacter segnis]|uniref:DUF2155 domain-containing protein n=2 Tax=Caulobacter segnis TaxID=88688 RepID=D5VJW0_CAUST|nr:DUF2155 domain-containing protein [Caulobacter segnis]ADG10639.1 Protein of unknown function DUF2155 [Caulobacter segnis ATCC 21756]AVQ02356.1 DUF2155 domain-containing protein [Caulobacter segnis]
MSRRASWIAAAAVLAGLAGTGAALARQAAPQSAQTPPTAPQAPVAPAARPAGAQQAPELRPSPSAQTAPAPAAASPQPAPAPAVVASDKPASPAVPVKPPEPAKRQRYAIAILQALDKVTTETMRFEVPVGQPIRYKTLVFTVRACETAAADEIAPETTAYVIVDTQPKAQAGRPAPPGRQIYKGWMYASSPGLNPLEHPVYDAWLIACKQSIPVAPPAKP